MCDWSGPRGLCRRSAKTRQGGCCAEECERRGKDNARNESRREMRGGERRRVSVCKRVCKTTCEGTSMAKQLDEMASGGANV